MRIFAALELPETVVRCISDWQEPYFSRYPSIKWVRVDRMHLTLRFFGNVPGSVVGRIREIMSSWHPGTLEFSLCTLGTFGERRSPSVFWLGGRFPEEISEIALELGRIADDKGRKATKRFIPHLTVARRKPVAELPELDPPAEINGVFTEAAVINSRLTPEGPEYEFLEKYNLH